jgi:putative ABC transport system ATP-binding protein
MNARPANTRPQNTTGMTRPAGVRIEGVSQAYRTPSGVVRALDAVTLDVEPGGSLAVVGRSGSGKSTLLGLIGGLETPTAGRIVLGGLELSAMSERRRDRVRREHLGFVFQSDNLLPYLTATENVALQLALHGSDVVQRRSLDLLAELGLADCVDKLPDQLSGGQRLRVAVARALVHRPAVILADEPTGAVDAGNAHLIVDLLLAAQEATGATLVVVTHDPDVASRLRRTAALADGSLVTDRRPGRRDRVG